MPEKWYLGWLANTDPIRLNKSIILRFRSRLVKNMHQTDLFQCLYFNHCTPATYNQHHTLVHLYKNTIHTNPAHTRTLAFHDSKRISKTARFPNRCNSIFRYKTPKKNCNQDAETKPSKLNLRRPSFKREIIADESFIDIQLKPVVKPKVEPQNAEEQASQLVKVTRISHIPCGCVCQIVIFSSPAAHYYVYTNYASKIQLQPN